MSKQASAGSGKRRKKGEWVAIANGRSHRDTVLTNGHGLSNIPQRGDVGSAAYRRSLAGRQIKSLASKAKVS